MSQSIPSIFLDRDGTINLDHGYVYEIDNFRFIESAIEAMLELKKMGYALILVTNQSGIARGFFTEAQFLELTKWMDWSLIDRGVEFDGIYYCPHHPDAIEQKYKQICDCRKPKAGMLLAARKQLNINMKASYMVGDKLSDMQASKEAHIGTNVLVTTGKSVTEDDKKSADWIINSLADLPNKIKNRQ
ncbi:D-glycero-beta-D-manno-heptose-1,7-bisphosphate 7-phosphatase [Arsenophonus endosymbiont of Bemisia tabaci Asia II 3]|nr:D-glycero-beta-D-manno-heptose-1,7-bisphosphate 7-phosphatase [Arsenophonus endosymbiont of Bemisia tabaci Asia II 3]